MKLMIYSFWHGLLVHCSSLILTKVYKFLKKSLIIHYRYFDFLFSGIFLHLFLKILLFFIINLQLNGSFNLILLLLSIYICTLVDIYYYIHYIIHLALKYVFYYLKETLHEEYIYSPEHNFYRGLTRFMIKYERANVSENYNFERDRFHFFKHFFSFFIAIRYFIIREPYVFSMLHILVFTNYLLDYSLSLLFIYLFIIQMSRFIFFMGPTVERFRFTTWNNTFIQLIAQIPSSLRYACATVPSLSYLKPDLDVDSQLLLKFTRNNINLIMYFTFRRQVTPEAGDDPVEYYHKLSRLYEEIESGMGLDRLSYFLNNSYFTSNNIPELYFHIPNLIVDSQRFVKKNRGFWLAAFIFYIYFEYTFVSALIMAAVAGNNIPYTGYTPYARATTNVEELVGLFSLIFTNHPKEPFTYKDLYDYLLILSMI